MSCKCKWERLNSTGECVWVWVSGRRRAWVVWGNWHRQRLISAWWSLRRRQRRCRLSSAARPAAPSAPAETAASCWLSPGRSARPPKASTLAGGETQIQQKCEAAAFRLKPVPIISTESINRVQRWKKKMSGTLKIFARFQILSWNFSCVFRKVNKKNLIMLLFIVTTLEN